MPAITTEDEIREIISKTPKINRDNYNYFQERFDEIQSEYAGEIIVVLGREVVESHEFTDDLSELRSFLSDLREEYGEEEIENAYITYVPDPDQVLIL